MFCHKCGTEMSNDSGFCHKCGTKIVSAIEGQAQQSVSEATSEPAPDIPPSTTTPNSIGVEQAKQGFREYVDNHVRSTTKFKPVDDLLNNIHEKTEKKMKKRYLVLAIIILIVLFNVFLVKSYEGFPKNARENPLAKEATSNNRSTQSNSNLTADDAKKLVEEWLVNHQFPFEVYIDFEYFIPETTRIGNKDYYMFSTFDRGDPDHGGGHMFIDIFVDKNTGEMTASETDGDSTQFINPKPLDEWYVDLMTSIEEYAEAQGDFNRTITFDNMEITFSSNYIIGQYASWNNILESKDTLYLYLTVTNMGNSPDTLSQAAVSVFGPRGVEIKPQEGIFNNNVFSQNNRGNLRPGATQELVLLIPYQGAGNYDVYFSGMRSEIGVTLPVSRNNSSLANGLVRRWKLNVNMHPDVHAGLLKDLDSDSFIELHEDGSGVLNLKYKDGVEFKLDDTSYNIIWHIAFGSNTRTKTPLLTIALQGGGSVNAQYSLQSGTLHLSSTVVYAPLSF